ncbi:MAG: type VI secretion system contractile sheath large subunit [Planctomycetia bacterium]|nr:type VI secretion system contractile sheath large subunit [Planctomycetia bacterium]
MAVEVAFGELKGAKEAVKAPPPETPFRIVVLGDFSGRANRGEVGSADDIGARKSYKIGRDNFDEIMVKVGVSLELPGVDKGEKHKLEFKCLDDFDADAVCQQVDQINDLDEAEQNELLARLLHHPDFQTVESAWRGLWWLLARIKEVRSVQAVVMDVSQAEFTADLLGNEDLTKTGLYQLLVEKPAAKVDGQPWALLVGLYNFEVSGTNANVLGRMAKIAREAVAPFLAAVPVAVADKDWKTPDEVFPNWEALRQLPEAPMLGLAMPRFLLRLPYGPNTKSIDKFDFNECPDPKDLGVYLWGNPGLLCACLLAQSFAKDGWPCKAGTLLDLPGMVMHVYTDEDDDRVSRMAEAMLARKEGEKIAALGFMNFICSKTQDVMQLIRFQSLGQPAKGQTSVDLMGQWGQKGAVKLPPSSSKPAITAKVELKGDGEPPAPAKAAAAAAPSAAKAGKPKKAAPPPEDDEVPAEEAHEDEAPAEEAHEEEAAAPAGGDEEMDPELAALMKQMEGGGDDDAAKEEKSDDKPAGEEEMDPELAALMKQLEGGGDDAAKDEDKKEDTEEKPAGGDEEMDPELAALMKQLEGGDDAAKDEDKKEDAEVKEDKADDKASGDDDMDPELAALMKQLEGGADDAPKDEDKGDDKKEEKSDDKASGDDEMDPELAALMKQLEEGGS